MMLVLLPLKELGGCLENSSFPNIQLVVSFRYLCKSQFVIRVENANHILHTFQSKKVYLSLLWLHQSLGLVIGSHFR